MNEIKRQLIKRGAVRLSRSGLLRGLTVIMRLEWRWKWGRRNIGDRILVFEFIEVDGRGRGVEQI